MIIVKWNETEVSAVYHPTPGSEARNVCSVVGETGAVGRFGNYRTVKT